MKINCPTCGKTTTWEENPDRPFCSEQCRLRDLGKWATEQYRIEGREDSSGGPVEEDDGGTQRA